MKVSIVLALLAVLAPTAIYAQCSTIYQQCGGIGWSGSTCCTASVCTYSNAYYSQCLPSSSTSATTTTTTPHTTSTTTTTTTTTTPHTTPTGGVTTTITVTSVTTSTLLSTITVGPACSSITTTTTTTTPHSVTSTTTTTTHSVTTTTTTTTTHSVTTTTTTTTTSATSTNSYTPGPTPPTGNPFSGASKFFIDITWTAMVDEFVANDTSLACAQAELDQTPTAVWLDTIAHASNLSWFLNQAAIQAAGETLVIIIVIYDLPGRDCHALASNGEIPAGDLSEYETSYINPIVATLKADLLPNIRVVLIIEPDSLPNGATNLGTQNCTQAVITGYQQGIAYAMASLTMENVWQYMDMGHGGWLGWPSPGLQNIGPLVTATISMTLALNPLFVLRGFITNTANYDPWLGYVRPARDPTQTWMSCNNYPSIAPNGFEWCYAYNAAIDEYIFHTEIIGPTFAALGLPNIWLFDSSRSGQAGVRENWGSWCNIVGAGIGPRPAASPQANDTTLDAFVWIKPPGTSDGNSESLPTHPAVDGFCDCTTTNGVDSLCPAPQAGFPFPAHFTMLVQNANPQLGTCSF